MADLNPRSVAVKSLETTVIKCLGIIELFDGLESGQDWTDVQMAGYRRVLGNGHYQNRNMIAELFRRWKGGTLVSEARSLFDNLPPAVQKRKEIKDGFARIDAGPTGRSKGPAVRPARRAGKPKR